MSIIVEGPDGGGKTTLIQQLQYDFPELTLHPRFCTSTGGAHDNLAMLVYDDLAHLSNRKWIYDRHPAISEYIYGHDIPERPVQPEFLKESFQLVLDRVRMESLVIWCWPSLETIKLNLDPDMEMPGVVNNIDQIYESYKIRKMTWNGHSAHFDFTDKTSYQQVKFFVDQHMHTRNGF